MIVNKDAAKIWHRTALLVGLYEDFHSDKYRSRLAEIALKDSKSSDKALLEAFYTLPPRLQSHESDINALISRCESELRNMKGISELSSEEVYHDALKSPKCLVGYNAELFRATM